MAQFGVSAIHLLKQRLLEELKNELLFSNLNVSQLADEFHFSDPSHLMRFFKKETGKTFMANARLKAVYYAKATGLPCIADDSGLEVLALEGAPGVRSARYAGEEATDEENNKLLLQTMKFQVKRTCRFRCALAVAAPNGKILLESDGICDGMLLHEPLGTEGFGYDPLFWSTELHKGLGEATMQEKNKISHRGKAIKKLVANWGKMK